MKRLGIATFTAALLMSAAAFAADPHHGGGGAPHGGGAAPHAGGGGAPHMAAPRMGGGMPHGGGGFAHGGGGFSHGGGMASFSHAAPSRGAVERRGGFASFGHTAPTRGIEERRSGVASFGHSGRGVEERRGVASFGHTTDVHRNSAANHSIERGMEAPRGRAAETERGRAATTEHGRGAYGGMEHAGAAAHADNRGSHTPRDARGFGTRPSNWNNRPHNFNRGDYQRNVQASDRFHYGSYDRPHGWYERRWAYGEYLPSLFWARDYWLTSWWMFDLAIPPYGYEWVRYGDDALLVNVDTGQILQVEYGVFY